MLTPPLESVCLFPKHVNGASKQHFPTCKYLQAICRNRSKLGWLDLNVKQYSCQTVVFMTEMWVSKVADFSEKHKLNKELCDKLLHLYDST